MISRGRLRDVHAQALVQIRSLLIGAEAKAVELPCETPEVCARFPERDDQCRCCYLRQVLQDATVHVRVLIEAITMALALTEEMCTVCQTRPVARNRGICPACVVEIDMTIR